MTEKTKPSGDAASVQRDIILDPLGVIMQRRAHGAENSELLLADEVRRLRVEVADLQAQLAAKGAK